MPRNNYETIIIKIFQNHFKSGITEFEFDREEFVTVAEELGVKLPKNLGDLIYTFRFRSNLPKEITSTAPEGKAWKIVLAGTGHYKFIISAEDKIIPSKLLEEIGIPDSTPGLISLYAYSDEQALLAILRYNRLLDIFTGKTCYSLQNHLRTSIKEIGQIETDEVYVGVDQQGTHYVFPVQAKGKTDKIGLVQVEQDFALCENKFKNLVCIPIAAQFITRELISLFSFSQTKDGIRITSEKHYKLIPTEDISAEEFTKKYLHN
jgi:hypothetical protein